MTWTNYQQYLEETILQKQEEEENEEENKTEESPYTLRPSAKTKYSITKEKELLATLTNLITSIENNEETNYHSLPTLDELMNESGQLKTWKDYFPNRSETHFGEKQEIEVEITSQTWTILGKIFNDYVQTATRKERLEGFANEDQMMNKVLMEGLVRLNTTALKKQGYDIQLKNWLKEYNQLEDGEKEALAKQKKQIETILATLEEAKEETETKSWYHNIPWKKVMWYGGGGLLVILIIGYLWRKLQE